MFIYQINLEYLGTNFVGWQFQKNGVSVQEVLEKALSKFLKDKIKVIGSGRTDAGVHAKGQSAHFKTNKKIDYKNNFINSMNFFLRKYPVSILSIRKRTKMFHARHSAKRRTYKYFIINRFSSLVLEKTKAWHVKKKLNIKIMRKGAKLLMGTHNFSTFRSSSCQSKSFLQQQVRSMVGAIKYLGEGKWSLKDFKKAFLSKKRSMCAPPAPAHGLYLYEVKY